MADKKIIPFESIVEKDAAIHRVKDEDGVYRNFHVDDYTILAEDVDEYRKVVKFEKGFHMSFKCFPEELALESEVDFTGGAPLFIACYLEGDGSYIIFDKGNEDKEANISIFKSSIMISRTTNARGVSIKHSGLPMKMVGIMIDPGLARIMFKKIFPLLKDEYRRVFEEEDIFFNFIGKASPVLVSICESVIKIDYTSEKNELSLRSKAIEILDHIFTEYMFESSSKGSDMTRSDISSITTARDILIENMLTPPTIPQLARMVHVNEFKLKKGFKEIFGNTLFGYLRQERLKKAKSILEQGDKNVSETAWDVGYTNVSHFISIFRNYYGINPGTFLINKKQTSSET